MLPFALRPWQSRRVFVSHHVTKCRCDQLIGDNGSEAESWANAGRQFILAEERLQDSKNASYTDMLEAGVQCFLLAIHVRNYLNSLIIQELIKSGIGKSRR